MRLGKQVDWRGPRECHMDARTPLRGDPPSPVQEKGMMPPTLDVFVCIQCEGRVGGRQDEGKTA